MEPQSGSKRSQDQLQGVALQNKAIQPGTQYSRILVSRTVSDDLSTKEKVVIQYGNRTIKGTAGACGLASVEELMRTPRGLGESIGLKLLDSGIVEYAPIINIKAVFLVKTFEGNSLHNPLHFHTHTPAAKGLWIRIQFDDEEVMEGIVCNSATYVLEPSFTLIPTDPNSNNKLVYVSKNRLKSLEVLGLRNPPHGQSTF